MSSKVKRKVTVENSKEDEPRRPSVFERLGPGAMNIAAQPPDRSSRSEHNEKCRNWQRTGNCTYGNTCRYMHENVSSSSRRAAKPEKDMKVKDLRHKVKTKRDEPKESRKHSVSPKRKSSKRSLSRSRKGDHDSKIKSTVVVTRARSPSAAITELPDLLKKKPEGNWEDDSDDWPMDAAQLDYKEELTLERKRQQLQRELELELQKERLLNENVTITKTVSFSESSSTTSSSDSGSISSSSESSSSSTDEDSNGSSSSSSSSSSSNSRHAAKKKMKKAMAKASLLSSKGKQRDDHEKMKRGRIVKAKKAPTPSPAHESRKSVRKGRDKKRVSPTILPKKRHVEGRSDSIGKPHMNVKIRGPRTPSPVPKPHKQRQWTQSSSTDSRSADALLRSKGKRHHKKKKDMLRIEKRKSDRIPSPPPLSSPNRLTVLPIHSKKLKSRDESGGKSRHRHREEPSPMLMPHTSTANLHNSKKMGPSHYFPEEKTVVKSEHPRMYARKEPEDFMVLNKRTDSRERGVKRLRISPRKETPKVSLSPLHKGRYENELIPPVNRKIYGVHEKEKVDRRRMSVSPPHVDRRKVNPEMERKRDIQEISPRDVLYRGNEAHGYDKRGIDPKLKRFVSPDVKKGREDKGREHGKDRNLDYDSGSWQGDHRKQGSSTGRHSPELRGRQEIRSQGNLSRSDRSRERDQDRKKSGKKRDLPVRSSEDLDRARLTPPRRSMSPLHGHHGVREIESLTGTRGRVYDSDIPATDRDYGYPYDSLHAPYVSDRLLAPDYETDVLRGSTVYPSEVFPESRYRRGGKDSLDRYETREPISPREVLPHREIISLTVRSDDYLSDLPIEDHPYDDRWPRGRARDDWDSYSSIPASPLPPHVTAALDEDRYGMPRRRRASPEWQRNRIDDRDSSTNSSHRQGGRGPIQTREGKSKTPPPKGPASNRSSWTERGGRHADRNTESRQHEDSQKSLDDKKGRTIRKDRVKPKEESSSDDKALTSTRERGPVKRPHSPSPTPVVKAKKKRNDIESFDILKYHGAVDSKEKAQTAPAPKKKEEIKEKKAKPATKPTAAIHSQKSGRLKALQNKQDVPSPKTDSLPVSEKSETSNKSSDSKTREDRKSRKNDDVVRGDDFSDWSDDDDDLLTRCDFVETEGTEDSARSKHKYEDNAESEKSRRKDKHLFKENQEMRKEKESSSRTSSKDKSSEESSRVKESKSASDGKETDNQESLSLKDDTATDVDEYITAESVDYDPISDDELDALIEEPDESILKPAVENEKSKIVNSLDVDWSALMSETKTEFVPGFARQRFKPANVLLKIGFSQAWAGPELTEKIINTCQKQLDEDTKNKNEEANVAAKEEDKKPKKFVLEHQLAAFHASISQNKRERTNLLNQVGPCRRALCARRDLQIRKVLGRPLNKLASTPTISYTPQYTVVDKELYKQSLELLKLKKTPEVQPQTVGVC